MDIPRVAATSVVPSSAAAQPRNRNFSNRCAPLLLTAALGLAGLVIGGAAYGYLFAAISAVVLSLLVGLRRRAASFSTARSVIVLVGDGPVTSILFAVLSDAVRQRTPRRSFRQPSAVIRARSLSEAITQVHSRRCREVVLADPVVPWAHTIVDARGYCPPVTTGLEVIERLLGRVPLDIVTQDPWFERLHGVRPLHQGYAWAKRALDIAVALGLGLVVLSILPLLALAIRLESRGTVFISQTRVGIGGRPFRIHKFRTMRRSTVRNEDVWAAEQDPSFTCLGRFMHLTRIEELPQLWNILLGDMTLVGPRPERLESAAVLNQELPGYPKRHAVKPGLIGWAQIQSRFGIGRSAENAQIELERDLYYVKHACLGMDLQILLRATLACVRAWPRSLIRWSATTLNVNRSSTVKRFMDILMALTGMVVLLPLLALVAAFVFAMMGRPVLFTQVRPGRHGRPFRMYKFRTMRNAFDSAGRPLSDADRLTRGGRLLRQLSLDELPQLWNVIKGDLSVVGPRPQLMDYLHRYTPEQARRHDVMPGITGWAQVNGRNAISWNERFELDVWYVDHWSLWLDFKILAMTVTTVLTGRGVSAPGQATMAPFPGTLTSASGSAD